MRLFISSNTDIAQLLPTLSHVFLILCSLKSKSRLKESCELEDACCSVFMGYEKILKHRFIEHNLFHLTEAICSLQSVWWYQMVLH